MPDWRHVVREHVERAGLEPTREADIVEELAEHLEARYADALTGGATEDEARRVALAELAENASLVRDLGRVAERDASRSSRTGLLADVARDLRHAVRVLRKHPGFATVATITLALGIGANTAIFSLVNGVLLRPLPYAAPDELVVLRQAYPQKGLKSWALSQANYALYRDHSQSFEGLAAFTSTGFNLSGEGEPERLRAYAVTADLFGILGVEPALGRGFRAEENTPGRTAVCVLGDGFWRRKFAADPSVVGRVVNLNGNPTEIIGVMPPGFSFPSAGVDMWVPLGLDPLRRNPFFLSALGRLKPGTRVDAARSETTALMLEDARHADAPPPPGSDMGTTVTPLAEALTGRTQAPLLVLLAAVALLLLVACANVANLLLARAMARSRELAVRAALGAGPWRVVRQLLTESLVLASLGAIAGSAVAVGSLRLLPSLPVEGIPRIQEVSVDGRALAFTAVVTVMTGILFGLAPAVRAARFDVETALREGARTTAAGSTRRLTSVLVGSQFALAAILLVGAGLLARSFENLSTVDPGFDAESVLTMRVALPTQRFADAPAAARLYDGVLERLRALPGVRAAGTTSDLAFAGSSWSDGYVVEGHEVPGETFATNAQIRAVSPGFFASFGMPILGGRDFTPSDTADAPPVAIIDDTLARQYFPDGDAVGQRVRFGWADWWMTIVGVVPGIRHESLAIAPEPHIYLPQPQEDEAAAQSAERTAYLIVRAEDDPARLEPAVRAAIHEVDADLPVYSVRPMTAVIGRTLDDRRLANVVLALVAVLAAALAGVGIYGVLASFVGSRTTEFGVRLALGARPWDLVRSVAWHATLLAAAGACIGTACALGISRALTGLLFDVSAADPVVVLSVPIALVAVGVVACLAPAVRAARVDPMAALRSE